MNALNEVLTAAEAAELWGLHESTVRRAIHEDRIRHRKSGGTQLVPLTEMERLYGPLPEHPAATVKVSARTGKPVCPLCGMPGNEYGQGGQACEGHVWIWESGKLVAAIAR